MKKVFLCVLIFSLIFLMVGCGSSANTNGVPDPDKIVPKREVLIRNLENSGYTITTLTTIDGSDLTIDRVMAQKGNEFIDIVYGLSAEDASKIFEVYCSLYSDDYYILARNGNYVYCVNDKMTFSKAGFTSTANVGVQYIHN
ncbi:MAG: hypothetical protein IJW40_03210 [Clostridia bacterium]|nr:hypothetical protein [Clostridia bacterium]